MAIIKNLSVIRGFEIVKAKRMRSAGHVARIGEKRSAYRLLVGKPEGWRPLGRLRRRWLDNIRMDLLEVGWGDVDCSCEFGIKPSGSINCWETIQCPNN
jgi:hypothetical protein